MSEIAKAFIAMMESWDAEQKAKEQSILKSYRALSTKDLKSMWDDPDLIDPDYIHRVLNERGEGEYCRV